MLEEELVEVKATRRRLPKKRTIDVSSLPVTVKEYTLSEDELQDKFPEGWKRFDDEVFRTLEYEPAKFSVTEHHVAVYHGKSGNIARAPHPKTLLKHSEVDEHRVVIYDYRKTRAEANLEDFVGDFNGTIVCDEYNAYHKLGKESEGQIKICGCWAHSRRKFSEIERSAKGAERKKKKVSLAVEALNRIRQLYDIEHVYTMKQAIQEGFILDVLKNYTTIDSWYKIAKKKLNGMLRAMVVTASISRCIETCYAINKRLAERHSPYKAIVAFSGECKYNGQEPAVTFAEMNEFPDAKIPKEFKKDPYRMLVVADMLQTGFNEPLLQTMYVDKPLYDIAAVQTLSRLNRAAPGKDEVYVLDFANKTVTIEEAFSKFYRTTILSGETDPNKLYD